jgi:hypothetical protein
MRSSVWVARGGREIAGGEHQVVKAAQDEASPAAFRRKIPEAQDLLLAEREGVLRWNLLEARNASRVRPCDGHAEAAAAAGELTKSAFWCVSKAFLSFVLFTFGL